VDAAKFLFLLAGRLAEIGATSASLRGGNGVLVCDLATLSCQ
jgi:hypothetical protein